MTTTTPTPVGRFAWEHAARTGLAEAKATPSTRLVGYVASTFADHDGSNVRPGLTNLQAATGLSRSSVLAALSWLRDAGWLIEVSRRRRTTSNSGGRSTVYRLSAPTGVQEVDLNDVGAPGTGSEGPGLEVQIPKSEVQNPSQSEVQKVDLHQPSTTTNPGTTTGGFAASPPIPPARSTLRDDPADDRFNDLRKRAAHRLNRRGWPMTEDSMRESMEYLKTGDSYFGGVQIR